MGRAPCCDKEKVKRGPWSREEDEVLKAFIEKNGTGGNWIALPHKIGLKRCGKSCRLRWLNYLRPNLKHGAFSEEEDNIICSLYISIGSRWSIIAAQLPGRTDNDIKNYWNTRLKKKLLGRCKEPRRRLSAFNQEGKELNGMDDHHTCSASFSSSALERIQLHLQLQSLQNPSSLYNNPALWPKCHVLGERILQSQYNDCNATAAQLVPITQVESSQKGRLHDLANSIRSNEKQEELENSLNGFFASPSPITCEGGCDSIYQTMIVKPNDLEQSNSSLNMDGRLQTEFNDLIYGKTSSFNVQDQLNRFDGVEELIGAKESMIWGANTNSNTKLSSMSWDPFSNLQPVGMFQEYVIGMINEN